MAASLFDGVMFTATSSGTGDFVVASAVAGYMVPPAIADTKLVRYRAQSADLSQWETGYGVYTHGTLTLARTTVVYNSAGTTAKIAFSAAPNVGLTFLKDDILSFVDTQSFSSPEKVVAQDNLGLAYATQAQMEAESAGVVVSPATQKFHPSAAKAWCLYQGTGTPGILASYNVSSVTRISVANYQVNWSTAFSSANYAAVLQGNDNGSGNGAFALLEALAAGYVGLVTVNPATLEQQDASRLTVVAYGDL